MVAKPLAGSGGSKNARADEKNTPGPLKPEPLESIEIRVSQEKELARLPLVSGQWQTIRFVHLNLGDSQNTRLLTIAFLNRPALLELTSIRVVRDSDSTVLYEAASAKEWEVLECSENLHKHIDGCGMMLLATGEAPQLHLPTLPGFHSTTCTLEIELRVETAPGELARRLHALRVEKHTLAEAADSQRLRAAQAEANGTIWK